MASYLQLLVMLSQPPDERIFWGQSLVPFLHHSWNLPFGIEKISNSLVIDFHVWDLYFVRDLGVCVVVDLIEEFVAETWNYTLVVNRAHHCERLARSCKTEEQLFSQIWIYGGSKARTTESGMSVSGHFQNQRGDSVQTLPPSPICTSVSSICLVPCLNESKMTTHTSKFMPTIHVQQIHMISSSTRLLNRKRTQDTWKDFWVRDNKPQPNYRYTVLPRSITMVSHPQ